MFKKLAIAIACLSCLYASANQSPFGINIEKTNIKDLQSESIKPSTTKPENIPGYTCTYLKAEMFSLNDNHPKMAKVFSNADGIIESLILEYSTDNTSELISDLDKKYPKTFSRKTFYGSCDIEYKNGNCLIRVVKPFGGSTLLLYGTIKWFHVYDEYYKQGAEVRKKRREFAGEVSAPISNSDDTLIQYENALDERFNHLRRHFFNSFWNFSDFDDCFENTKNAIKSDKTSKTDNDTKIKSYRSEKRYSKVGDVEEWFYDDNGNITKIKKTPEGTTVTHGDKAKTIQAKDKSNEQLLYGRQIKDAGL